ncbi:exonuclease SbcC [Hydrogenivirga caldilitoris]|uniref:Exonuclease SbcC n=1 Tax=Hydrogenivirga caldilitoris TaxID=246264 RepID=A0A497XMC2_9AQUI|nr:AAA family ATPase [Hydrogenivirga caldilitoris]RLJ69958.1 exonuclease SbcC [Hydrogenivirga caldilitoris]
MRPLKLELEGFTVYKKSQVIDFEKLNFFIIQGKTGAGKTSIVDAITFALYGKVPRYGKSRSATTMVMSKGSKKLKVSLEFSVGGKRYRIERFYREKPKEDVVRVEEEGRRLDLKKTDIEGWVEKVTGLDYNTFTKVILLPQGEFDKFLKPSSPKERRDILIGLLNLEVFDRVRELAAETYRSLEGQLNAIKAELESLSELTESDIEELERRRQKLEREVEGLRSVLSELEERLRRAREREETEIELVRAKENLEGLLSKSQEFETLKRRVELARRLLPYLPYIEGLERIAKELRDLRLEREKVLKKKIEVEEELKNVKLEREEVEREYSKLPKLREELHLLVSERERLSLAKEELSSIEQNLKAVEEKEKVLRQKEEVLKDREEKLQVGEEYIRRTEEEINSLGYDEEEYERLLKEVEKKQTLLEQQRRLEEIERELKELESLRDVKVRELKSLRESLEEAERELQESSIKVYVQHIRAHLKEGDQCPVCGGEFKGTPEGQESADTEGLRLKVKELQNRLLSEEKELSSLEAKVESLTKERESLSSKLRGWENILKIDIESRLKTLEEKKKKKKELEEKLKKFTERYNQRLREREEALREVERLKSELSSLKSSIDEKRKRLSGLLKGETTPEAVDERLSELAFKEKDIKSKIEEVERKREEIGKYIEELNKSLIFLDTKLSEIESSIEGKEKEKKENSRKLAPLFEELGDLDKVKELSMTQEELSALERELETYNREVAGLEDRIKELERKLSQIQETEKPENIEMLLASKREELEQLLKTVGELKITAQQKRELLEKKESLGKRASEIEREILIYSQISEDLKSNKLQDFAASLMLNRIVERASEYLYNFTNTYEFGLDDKGELVVIDRAQGTERDVKSLSGGETFLASLSLALGVSDILSADAHLESLFIDEGFGSLDEETRERVSDILEVIKQRINRMVGIISHIPDLAERFHQRVVVKKHGDFSTVEVFY